MRISISDSKPYIIHETGKVGTREDFESDAKYQQWLDLQAKIEKEPDSKYGYRIIKVLDD